MTRARRPFSRSTVALAWALAAASCDDDGAVPSLPPLVLEEGACGHGLVVVASDYASTTVSVLGFDGKVVARDWIDSGTAAPGLSATFSGDTVTPTDRSDQVVLVDRSASSITWIAPKTGVVDQLAVGTGFAANPYDVLSVAPGKTYVARFARNGSPGREPFDGGSDVVVVDEGRGAIVGRVDLDDVGPAAVPDLEPRPVRLHARGSEVVVLLAMLSSSYDAAGDGRLAVVDPTTDAVTRVVELPSARNCNGLTVSPSGRFVGVSCSGTIVRHEDGTLSPTVDESFVIVLDAEAGYSEVARFAAAELGQSFTFTLAFASETHLLAPTFGQEEAPRADDRLIDLDVTTGQATVVHTGPPLSLGDVRCVCNQCFVADTSRAGLLVLGAQAGSGAFAPTGETDPITALGLPARSLGVF